MLFFIITALGLALCAYIAFEGEQTRQLEAQAATRHIPAREDAIIWPDGTWCYREELSQYSYMSDDYIVLPVDTHAWHAFLEEEGLV